jgi:hypothetical protein
MPPGSVAAGPAWLSPPDRMPWVQPEKKIAAATIATPPPTPTAAAIGARHDALLTAGPGLSP